MQEKAVQEEIGKIVQNFALIEWAIQGFVTHSYFGSTEALFRYEVLEDQYFNFFLLRRIFYKLLGLQPKFGAFPRKELDRMNELRNIFAHSKTVAEGQSLNRRIYFSNGGKKYEIEGIVKEYNSLKETVIAALNKLEGVNIYKR